MFKPKSTKDRISHRLKISLGHLKKVIEMTEEGSYCIDILHQSYAVQKALEEADAVILKNHLETCVADAITNGRKEEVIEEIMGVFKKSPKNI